MHDDPNKDPSETWREHLKRTHAYLKQRNPGSKLMDAVKHARDFWRERKSHLYETRQRLVGELRKRKSEKGRKKNPVKQKADNDKADRVELKMAADILTLLKNVLNRSLAQAQRDREQMLSDLKRLEQSSSKTIILKPGPNPSAPPQPIVFK